MIADVLARESCVCVVSFRHGENGPGLTRGTVGVHGGRAKRRPCPSWRDGKTDGPSLRTVVFFRTRHGADVLVPQRLR